MHGMALYALVACFVFFLRAKDSGACVCGGAGTDGSVAQ